MSIRRDTASNVAGALVPLLATLITLPIYLRAIGEDRYGILVVLWTLLGYFGLFDFGLGRAVTNRIAAMKGHTPLEREEVFWTAMFLNLGLGCLGALALMGSGTLVLHHLIELPGPLSAEVFGALPWVAAAFPLLLSSSVMSGALRGVEQFMITNLIAMATGVLIQVAPLVAAVTIGPALPTLVVAVLGVRVLGCAVLLGACVSRLPTGLRPRLNRSHVHPLFSFGCWVAVTSIVGPLLTTLDRLLIGAVAGVKAVTYYSVPFSLASRISILPGGLSNALFPRFSSFDQQERTELGDIAVRTLVTIMTPLVVGAMFSLRPFLTWWVGPEFAVRAAPVGEVLLVGIWANCLAYIPFASIQASGRPDLAAKFHLAELLPYLGGLWLALEWRGAVGAAVAWSVRAWVDAILMFAASPIRDLRGFPAAMVGLGGAFALVARTPSEGWAGLGLRVAMLLLVLAWAWRAAPRQVRDLVALRIIRPPSADAVQA